MSECERGAPHLQYQVGVQRSLSQRLADGASLLSQVGPDKSVVRGGQDRFIWLSLGVRTLVELDVSPKLSMY